MNLKIDSREQNRIQLAKEYYTKQGLEVSVEELEVGDYIFSDGNDEVVFEFKLISDFVASIQDGRVFNQCIEQAENFNHHFCIIHGDLFTRSKCLAMTKHYRRVTIFQYLSAIASIDRYSTVIECYNHIIDESFYRMMITAKKCLLNKPIVKKFPKKDKNPAFNFLCHDVYGINHKKARLICNKLNLYSKKDLDHVTKDDLTSIEGIADKTAEKILKAIGE